MTQKTSYVEDMARQHVSYGRRSADLRRLVLTGRENRLIRMLYFLRIPLSVALGSLLFLLVSCGDSSVGSGDLVPGGPGNPGNPGSIATRSAGDIVSSEPIQLFLTPGVPLPGTSQLIKYQSKDHTGRPVLVTATVTTPLTAWTGPGQRPIVSYAVGTHGLGDACAPSRTMTQGIDNDSRLVALLLLEGYGVVITDYAGSGTDEPATYINRLGQGQAVLDAIRAAQRLPIADLPDDGPVATFGYSQGGEGSAAALEIQPIYAPELKLIGSYAGAIPSDSLAVIALVDGGPYTAFLGYFINGLNNAFPQNRLFDQLNVSGKAFATATSEECVPAAFVPRALVQSSSLFSDGRSLVDHLGDVVWQAPIAAQFIGQAKPSAPVFVAHSVADDVIPLASSRDAAARWCALGATVQFMTVPVPAHLAASNPAATSALAWLRDRVAGMPAPNNCGQF